jgi:hypothetical protein
MYQVRPGGGQQGRESHTPWSGATRLDATGIVAGILHHRAGKSLSGECTRGALAFSAPTWSGSA